MLFRFYFCLQILLLASFSLPVSHAFAQREDMAIGDQPGLIPNPSDEELPLQFRRQVVLYRSSEAPGTIIVHTSERFLYVVQPNGRALRYGIGVGRASTAPISQKPSEARSRRDASGWSMGT